MTDQAQDVAQARRVAEAREAAREARDAAREAREVAKEGREKYAYRVSQVTNVLHPVMLVVAILYPTVIGFTLQSRGWNFSLTHPSPYDGDIWKKDNFGAQGDGYGPNQWVTFRPEILARTLGSFLAYTVVHTVLAAQMRLRGQDDAPALSKAFSWVVLIIFCYVGTRYFYVYVSLSRYGTHWTDWAAMGGFSGLLVGLTGVLLWYPVAIAVLIQRLAAADPAADDAAKAAKLAAEVTKAAAVAAGAAPAADAPVPEV